MKGHQKNQQVILSVLNLPPKTAFTEILSPSLQYHLYQVQGKKMLIQAYRIKIQKTKLFNNLQIYQWRNQTQFPFPKTKYVSIQPHQMQSFHSVQLIVFNQHCPLKLGKMHDMIIAQTLYMLKQAIIGFQRLCSKFGTFQVRQNMIGVNEKGLCKVWLNENFALNSIQKSQINEQSMIISLIDIMQKHCEQNILNKKLYTQLNNCKTFLSVLKQIDGFLINQKIDIPTRNSMNSFIKQLPKSLQYIHYCEKIGPKQWFSQPIIHGTTSSGNTQRSNVSQPQNILDIQKNELLDNKLKISIGETAFTSHIKCSNAYLMIPDDKKKDKKQLSYSQSNSNQIYNNNYNNYYYKLHNNNMLRKSQNQAYTHQFNYFGDTNRTDSPSTSRFEILEEGDQQKYREEHSENIMRSNGWNGLAGFLNIPKQMKQSFHEGQQEIRVRDEVKLLKLHAIGKRPIAMSILPSEEYQGII